MLILLDNGHGKDTKGKRSPIWADGSQLFEWEFNRDLVRRIKAKCDQANIHAMVVVAEDYDVSLAERCRRVNAFYEKCKDAVLLSIHANACENSSATGFEVFTSVGETRSDRLATKLIERLERDFPNIRMRKDFTDGDADKEANFYILRYTNCPAILAENLFMTTESDCRKLMDSAFRERLAESYFNWIKEL